MSKKKFYAVKIGRQPGIYQSWSQAEEQVKGYSGADYRSFSSEKEANDYLELTLRNTLDEEKDTNIECVPNEIDSLEINKKMDLYQNLCDLVI